MRTLGGLALVVAVVVASTSVAHAGRRATHTAVGAVVGGLIAGPVGFVGGGAIGYVGGRQIACDLGVERCYRHRRYRYRR
jgi:hypothetical protein